MSAKSTAPEFNNAEQKMRMMKCREAALRAAKARQDQEKAQRESEQARSADLAKAEREAEAQRDAEAKARVLAAQQAAEQMHRDHTAALELASEPTRSRRRLLVPAIAMAAAMLTAVSLAFAAQSPAPSRAIPNAAAFAQPARVLAAETASLAAVEPRPAATTVAPRKQDAPAVRPGHRPGTPGTNPTPHPRCTSAFDPLCTASGQVLGGT